MKKRAQSHLHTVSKCRLKAANGMACDQHNKEIQRKKCHKGKISPPNL